MQESNVEDGTATQGSRLHLMRNGFSSPGHGKFSGTAYFQFILYVYFSLIEKIHQKYELYNIPLCLNLIYLLMIISSIISETEIVCTSFKYAMDCAYYPEFLSWLGGQNTGNHVMILLRNESSRLKQSRGPRTVGPRR